MSVSADFDDSAHVRNLFISPLLRDYCPISNVSFIFFYDWSSLALQKGKLTHTTAAAQEAQGSSALIFFVAGVRPDGDYLAYLYVLNLYWWTRKNFVAIHLEYVLILYIFLLMDFSYRN
ncbi:unnamed protein product [Agarophyton chilense]